MGLPSPRTRLLSSGEQYVKCDYDDRLKHWDERFKDLREHSDLSQEYRGIVFNVALGQLRERLNLERRSMLYDSVKPYLVPLLGPGRNILEVSTGPAASTQVIVEAIHEREGGSERGGIYSGIDLVPRMVQFTQELLEQLGFYEEAERVWQSVATELTWHPADRPHHVFAEHSQHVVIFGRIGNHLLYDREWEAALEQVLAVLASGGHVIVYESFADLMEEWRIEQAKARQPRSSKFRTRTQYERKFSSLGFRMVDYHEHPDKVGHDSYGICVFRHLG